jgi:RNA polymerase sigma factor (TIGR02999 family)
MSGGGVTDLLAAHRNGDAQAFERMIPIVYADLRRLARAQLRRLRIGGTLDTTALVHEAYLKLVDQERVVFQDRSHFLAVSSIAMRRLLVDHARHRGRDKRGGGAAHAPIDALEDRIGRDARAILELDMALNRLAAVDARMARVVDCRYFAGFSEAETAEALGVSLRTAQREWLKARAWLREELGRGKR